jgi:putative NADPH-quinone reductase
MVEGRKKRILIIHAHPLSNSFNYACLVAVKRGLLTAGYETRVRHLYSYDGQKHESIGTSYTGGTFDPVLSAQERREYGLCDEEKIRLLSNPATVHLAKVTPEVKEAIEDLRWCDALVLVYPTWWFNMPAILKGYIDRIFLNGVAFKLPEASDSNSGASGLISGLPNIQKLGVVTTYGAKEHIVHLAGDSSRRFISHGLRPILSPNCLLHWSALYDMDTTDEQARATYLAKVEDSYSRF